MLGEYVLYQARERTTVISCQITDSYYPPAGGLRAAFARRLCAGALRRGGAAAQENGAAVLLLLRALAYLSYDTVAPRRVTAVFLMGMMSLLGFRPQVGRCAQCGTPIALDGRADDDYAAYFGAQAGGVLWYCGAGGGVRLTAGEVRYLQAIMRRGLETLSEAGECSDALGALRQMAQERLGADSLESC
ncbi:MAG: DNA repair protein RecO C-terminal domain-containing protein [Christensenellales bacterium]